MSEAVCVPAPAATGAPLRERLPVGGLLALAAAGFLTILTEALPAGLLPSMGASLGVSPALVGQLVTAYALGSTLAAIPLAATTRHWRRRRLLLLAIGGFALVNAVTALSTHYGMTLVARFFGGVFAGLLWALVAGQASRMVAPALQGRAIALAMVGVPLALSLGIPAGTFLGPLLGWQAIFGLMSVLTLALLGWVRWQVPDFSGESGGHSPSLRQVFQLPGLRPVLFVLLAFVLAHNILYTYIAPFLDSAGLGAAVDVVLLVFGIASLVGIWLTGALIDRWLRTLVLASTAVFGVAMLALGLGSEHPGVVYAGVAFWGLAFGGGATLFQTATAQTAGASADVAQSMLVTAWNLAMAAGGVGGGLLLGAFGPAALPWTPCLLLMPAFWVAWRARTHGFPARH